MKKILIGVKSFLCNIKTLIFGWFQGFLFFAKKTLLSFAKRPLTFALRKYIYILFSLVVALALFGSSFLSCAPDFADQGSGNSNTSDSSNNNDDDDDDDDDPDETCDDNEGEPCRGNETCERVCESIFEEYGEIRACINTGDETVDKLQKVHNLLMGKNAGVTSGPRTEVPRSYAEVEDDLKKIGADEDDDGVDRDAFQCYLQIGASKYISQIKRGLVPAESTPTNAKKRKRLLRTLEWMVKDKESAEILADVNAGDDILESLLFALGYTFTPSASINIKTHCLGGATSPDNGDYDVANDTDLEATVSPSTNQKIWVLTSANKLVIRYFKSGSATDGSIELDSTHDKKLFQAISCMHEGDAGNRNIFSYSAKEENQHIFNLAFELLSDICEDVKNKSDDRDKACARALMCWTAWQNACATKGKACTIGAPDNSANNKLWDDMLDEHESALEKSGGSNYKECAAEDFKDFFP